MGKSSHTGPKKSGMQDIKSANDYGAREAWNSAQKPASVKGATDKTSYKHRDA